jgi:soluble lytic murein transglycosylase-like protein
MSFAPRTGQSVRPSKRRTLLPLLAASVLLSFTASAQTITTVVEHGRRVFRNDESTVPAKAVQVQAPQSRYVYWSVTENRWKPVPAPSASALRAARSAAAEVNQFVAVQPPQSGRVGTSAMNPNYRNLAGGRVISTEAIDSAIQEAAVRHNVDPNLVKAIIKVESNFNPGAVSRKGAMGLMQLMPSTARSLNVTNPFDPQQNVDAGVRHLKGLLENFGGDVSLSLAAYNAGQGAVTRSGGIPPYSETRDYVRRITDIYGNPSGLSYGYRRVPIKAFRNERGVLTFSNVE